MTPPVVVGSASRDLAADDPRGWRLGGAVAYAGLTLARLGLRPRVLVGVDATAAGAWELAMLADAGAEVWRVPLEESPVFENRERAGGRVQTCVAAGRRLPVGVPDGWASAGAWLLVPVADELDPGWAGVPPEDALVAVGWQGLLRTLSAGADVTRREPAAGAILGRASIVGVSRHDLDPGVPVQRLGRLLRPPVTLLLTAGPAGGTAIDFAHGHPATTDGRGSSTEGGGAVPADGGAPRVGTRRAWPAIPAQTLVDPTGAGDAFLAAYVAARLGHPLAGSGRRGGDLRLAAAVGSLVVERPGLLGVPDLAAIAARLRSTLGGPRATASFEG